MKKLILLLFIPIAISLSISCGENSKKKVENIPDRLIQVWDQSKCEVCDDPWRKSNEKIDDYTNLISIKDEYGDKSMTAESYVLFKNVPLTYAEGYKRSASFKISYQYYAKNCWSAQWRDNDLILGSPGYWSEKNVEWIKNANNGDRFDVLMYQPEFIQKNPSSACDYTTFDIVPANYDKIVVFPAGELNIEQTGDYKFKVAQGDFKLISNNIYKDNNLNTKEMAEVEDINLAIITDSNGTTNVRSGKGTNNPVIYELKTNETFNVYPSSDKWWLVELRNKQKGYIFYDRVSLIRNGLDGRYTEVSNYFLQENDLESYANDDLKIMRNEIFARNGYIFKEGGEMNNYFTNVDWYKPKFKNVDANLTQVEKYNIKFIKKVENRNLKGSSIQAKDKIITFNEATDFMRERCKNINQTLMKTHKVEIDDGKFLYVFLSYNNGFPGILCVSVITDISLELLASDCGPAETKMQDWEELLYSTNL